MNQLNSLEVPARRGEQRLRACLLGKGDLLLQCADLLLDHGYEIAGVASASSRVERWAGARGILSVASFAGLLDAVDLTGVDDLFSIINPEILPEAVLRMPRRLAINYHNSPLPRYAGVFATSWAILHGEREHGVTWHVMEPQIDAGDILKQVLFPVDDDETTFSLNVKCHEHAVASFAQLAAELSGGEIVRLPQDLANRSYFGTHRKFPGAGILFWDDPADRLGRTVRALSFGGSPNRLGVAKVQIGDTFFVLPELEVLPERSGAAPGTILGIGPGGLRIATGTEDVQLEGVLDLTGERVSPAELARRYGLHPGSRLPSLRPEDLSAIEQRVVAASPHEPFWREKIKTAAPLSLATLGLESMARDGEVVCEVVALPEATEKCLAAQLPVDVSRRDALLAALLIGLGNESGEPDLSVGLAAGWKPGGEPLERLFVDHLVLTVAPPAGLSFVAVARLFAGEAAEALARGRFLRDIVLRHPMLQGKSCRMPVKIEIVPDLPASLPAPRPSEDQMTVSVSDDGRWLRLEAQVGEEQVAAVRSILLRLLRHVLTVLASAAEAPLRRLADIPLLTRSEEQQVVREWNDTSRRWSGPVPTLGGIAEVTWRAPEAIAVVADDGRWTYSELDTRAAAVAAALRRAGVGAGDFVAIYVQRSPELVAALLGILRLGAVYVPLDPAQPEERLLQALADCAAGVLLLGPGLEGGLTSWRGNRLSLATACGSPASPLPPTLEQEEMPAFLMFTSGSTGRPKGVLCTRGGLTNRLLWALDTCALGPGDRVLQVAAIGFDISVIEMLLPLCSGGRLVIAAPELHRDPGYLVSAIRSQGVTLVHFVPTLLRAFLEHPESGLCRTLRHAFSGGEALPAELVERLLDTLPVRLYNAYGPTETSVSVTHWEARAGCRPLLGRPIANTSIFLLDVHLRPVPPGCTGEICIGGSGVAQGYLDDPALTAERFIPNPFGGTPGLRLYRTGDMARFLPGGDIDFLGRRDRQVKVRGIRVELGEIESLLARHPDIEQAIVLYRESSPDERHLVAYLLCHELSQTTAGLREQLRQRLLATLPEAMVPTFFVFLVAIPLLPSGKVKYAALPEPRPEDRVTAASYAAPHTQLEWRLASAWSEILSLPLIGVHDDVFSLGAHSLHATRMKLWLQDHFGLDLPLRAIFENRTVAQLTTLLEPACRECGDISSSDGELVGGTRFPLSFAQERVWFLDQLLPSQGLYNVPMAFALRGRLDEEALARSLERVVWHHDTLVSRLVSHDGELWQERSEQAAFGLRVIDLTALDVRVQESEVRRLETFEARRAFDFDRGPLIRAWLLRTGPSAAVLVVVAHHIAFDGWSATVFCRDLSRAYEHYRRGEEPILSAPKAAFGQLASWQRQRLGRGVLERSLAYWERQLAGAPSLQLPTDYRPPKVRSHRGGVRRLRIPRATWGAIRGLGERQGATPFMVLLTAFQVLLHRWTGQADVVVGTPFAGRSDPLAADLVGMFVNSVALRGALVGDPSFLQALAGAREATLAAHEHQDAPFEKVVERLRIARSPDRHPVYQTMLVVNQGWQGDLRLDDLEIEPVPVSSPVAMFDLTLTTEESGGCLELELEHASELFAPATVERLMRSLARLLEAVAADPNTPVGDYELLPDGERHALLVEWNDTAAPLPEGLSLARFLAERAAGSPDAPAVLGDGKPLTHGELNARANRLAAYLRLLGVGPESRVALLLERSADLVIALLAVLKAGGAYVPLDLQAPRERLERILVESGARWLITRTPLAGAISGFPGLRVWLDVDGEQIGACPAGDLPELATHQNLAYVLYTSGTTGHPKGVLVERRSLLNYVLSASEQFGLRPADRVLQFASIAFDTAAEEIFPTLLAGAALVLRDDSVLQGIPHLLSLCGRHAVTVLDLPTAYFHLLAAELADGAGGELPSSLRLVIVGGERLLPDSVRLWRAGGPRRPELLNTYGPTEATIVATGGWLAAGWDAGRGEPSIGRPVRNVEARVLDRALRPVPIGVPGELCLGGAGVSRGYLGRPAETAERFVPEPCSSRPGAVMYRTEDRARWLPDGRLEFLGRLDRQVKLRGYRVEPAEVEAALARHPMVAEVAVIVRQSDGMDPHLVACVVPRSGVVFDAGDLRRHGEGLLPAYMVPARFVRLDSLPRQVSGKLDLGGLERSLPAIDAEGAAAANPRTALEGDLATLWAALLGLPEVGVNDDFFALGGHSLLATRLVSRLPGLFAAEVPVRAFFTAPTVAGLAREIEMARRSRQRSAFPPIGRRKSGQPVPLTPAQRRIWFLEEVAAEPGLYNVPTAHRVFQGLDPAILRRALDRLPGRHEALRCAIGMEGDRILEVAESDARPLLSVADLTVLSTDARRHHLIEVLESAGLAPFDLGAAPLWRVHLVLLEPAECVLLLTAHHLIADGWSMDILLRDVVALYDAEAASMAAALPPVEVQYGDFAVWLEEELANSSLLAEQLEHWCDVLRDAPEVVDLPVDRPRHAGGGHAGAGRSLWLAPDELARLRLLGQAHKSTLFMTLLAVCGLLLHRLSGQDDLVVGTPIANRHYPGVEGTVGLFVNSLPLRLRLVASASFSDLLRVAREGVLTAFEHQDVPFERIVEALDLERRLDRTPVFQTLFTLEEPVLPTSGGEWEEIRLTPGLSKLDLSITAREDQGALEIRLDYRRALFDDLTVARFARSLEALLTVVMGDQEVPAAELSLLAAAERHQVLTEWNERGGEDLGRIPLHRLFSAQTARTPDLPAVTEDGLSTLTYRELDAASDALAHRLLLTGVDSEVAVGVCQERSIGLVTAILAIFKAGGVYVPLDPANPRERLLGMVAEADVRVLIVSGEGETLAAGFAGPVIRPAGEVVVSSVPLSVDVEPDAAAYILFTSGSTGKPKGVVVSHRAIANRVAWSLRDYPAGTGDSLLHIAQIGFDIALWEVFCPLLSGSRLVLAPRAAGRDPRQLHDIVVRQGITILHCVPTLLASYLEERPRETEDRLRLVVCGGEVLGAALLRRFAERCSARLCHAYGPTEAAISVAHWELDRAALASLERVPLGRPLTGTRLLILDSAYQLLPPGGAGELCISGVPLARGYARRPDLTAERFVPDPWSPVPGGRLYRTGDWARHRFDGLLEFLGRRDRQLKIGGYRIEAGEVEITLEEHPSVLQAVVAPFADAAGRTRLAAWIVCRDAFPSDDAQAGRKRELRRHLEERLPKPMVPAALILLQELPLAPSGKVDRKALPSPQLGERWASSEPVPPRTDIEARLAALWAELLGVERVGIFDNFFEVGGDSIASIQLVARARQACLQFDVSQLFRTPTVAGLALAAVVREEAPAAAAEDVLPSEGIPLTPIQSRFFARGFAVPSHFNLAQLLSAAPEVSPSGVRQAVAALVSQHDALRLCFRYGGAGWEQGYRPVGGDAPVIAVDLTALPATLRRSEVAAQSAQAQASLDLGTGALFRAVWFDLKEAGTRLLLVAHHLVVDVVSWRILLADLEMGLRQAASGEAVRLPARTRSYGAWAQAMESLAADDLRQAEIAYWETALPAVPPALPLDHPAGRNREADAETLTVALDSQRTHSLLERVPQAYGNRVPEVLLAAAAQAVGDLTGRAALLVEVEGHGRGPLPPGMDVSRTVGWFTAAYPLWLDLAAWDDPGFVLKEVKERSRRVPAQGVGFGALRYGVRSAAAGRLARLPSPAVTLNYLGPSLSAGVAEGLLRPCVEFAGPGISPANQREAALEIGATIRGGQLEVAWTYSREQLSAESAQRLAGRFRERLVGLVDHAARPEVFGYTPSDFPLAAWLDQAVLDALLGGVRGVEDVYPLSPMQGGFLFQALYRPGTTVYFTQIIFELHGDLREDLLREAWRLVVERHSALRSAFFWQDVSEPVQYVMRSVEIPWIQEDWRGTPADGRREQLEAFLDADRSRGFCLSRAPLLRLAFLDLAPGRAWLVWSHQHILLDGWSLPLVWGEVMTAYGVLMRGETPALRPVRPFRDYVEWLQRQDPERAEAFWRRELEGIFEPCLLSLEPSPGAVHSANRVEVLTLPCELTAALRSLSRSCGLTLSTVVQGAWAFFLGRYTGRLDVVFGVSVAGRPIDLVGAEEMVGLFINTVPLCVRLSDSDDLVTFLGGIQERLARLQEHVHLPLVRIQACSGAPRGRALFDTLIVFESYPLSPMSPADGSAFEVASVEALEQTEYPLTLTVLPGEELRLELSYSPERFEPGTVEGIAGSLAHILTAFAGVPLER